MIVNYILLLLSLLSLASLTSGQTVSNATCIVYEQLHDMVDCGPKGYAEAYGLPLCNAFVNNNGLFDAVGQKFLNCSRECLANYVRNVIIADHITNCTAIEIMAYSSHVPCYKTCGFCRAALTNEVGFAATFRLSDFFSTIALQQVQQVALYCLLHPSTWLLG